MTSIQSHRPDRMAISERLSAPMHVRLIAYAFLVSVPFEIDLVAGGRSVSFWLGLALVGVVCPQLLTVGEVSRTTLRARIVLPVLSVAALAWLTSLWSMDVDATFAAALGLTSTVITCLALAVAVSGSMGGALNALALGTSIASGMALTSDVTYDGRAETMANANDLAVVISMSATYLIASVMRRGVALRYRLFALALAVLHVAGLLATGSRTGVIAVVFAFGCLVLVNVARLRIMVPLLLAGIIAVVVTGIALFDVVVPERIMEIPNALGQGDLNSREDVWGAAFGELPQVLGIGFAATPAFMQEAIGMPVAMHSVYIGIALEAGVVGLMVWGWMVVRLVKGASKSVWAREIFLMGTALAVMASTLSLEGRRPLWIYIGLLAALSIRATTSNPKREQTS